jgi:hypothetical protein
MSKQAKDAPNEPDAPRAPAVSSGVQTSQDAAPVQADRATEETILPSGDTVTIALDPAGSPMEVVDVTKGEPRPIDITNVPFPSAEYGFRPEPIPGPSVEELKLRSVEGYPEQPSAQEIIMQRAQAQADAIVKAAENAVANMDKAEAAARGENTDADPDLRHVSVLDPNTGVVQPDQSVPLTNDDDARVAKAEAKTETKSNK